MAVFRKNKIFLCFCFLISAVYLLIASKSSPLYPMNDWVDVNCFFTMGKSMLDGLVPYVDLYEQKGPVLYFIYAILALISRDSFFAVYLLEVITYGLFLYFSGKIARLYLGEGILSWFLVAIEGGLILITRAFAHGGSVEEICLFISAYGLYVVLKALKEGRTLTFREGFLCGIFAAILLWIKYTMLGLYLGLAIFIILWYLGWGHGFKALWHTIGAFFAGLGAVTAVVFVYFLLNGALDDLFTVYFYNNIFLYAKEPETSRLQVIYDCLKSTLDLNKAYTLLLVPGILWALVKGAKDIRVPIMLVMTFLGLSLGTYWGGWGISYYGLVFAVYTIFGLIAIGEILLMYLPEKPAKKKKQKQQEDALSPVLLSLCLASTVLLMTNLCLTQGRNVYLMDVEKEDMPQYQFAEIINQVEDATLINHGFLDGGFYFAADVTPTCRFFCILNVQAPDMWSSQRSQIAGGQVDFVVTRDKPLTDYQVDSSLYTLVDESQLYFEGKTRTYYLYQLVSSTN